MSLPPIPIDPLLSDLASNITSKQVATNIISAELASTDDGTIPLTSIEQSVLAAGARARNKMANQYNKHFVIDNFETDAIVSLRIPKEDRGTLDYSRLYARVLQQPHPGRYQLQTQHGILDRLFPTGELNRVPPLIGIFIF